MMETGKKQHEKPQGLKEELERSWRVKAIVVSGALGAVTPTLEKWLQQIHGDT